MANTAFDAFMAEIQKTKGKPLAQQKAKPVDVSTVLMGNIQTVSKPHTSTTSYTETTPIETVESPLKKTGQSAASFLSAGTSPDDGKSTLQKTVDDESPVSTKENITSQEPVKQAQPAKRSAIQPAKQEPKQAQQTDSLADLIAKAVKMRKAADASLELTKRAQMRASSEFAEVFHKGNPDCGTTFAAAFGTAVSPAQPTTLKVAAYIRVSTDSSDQENSYETQERYFTQLLSNNPAWISAGIYSDYGISGTNKDKRTGFKRLLRHCRDGRINRIVCKSISRFARNTEDFVTALKTLRENNVSILFEKENLDTTDAVSEFILTTLGAIAQEESRSISANIRWGNQKRFPKGDVRNIDIYGYRFTEDKIVTESGYAYKDVEIVEKEAEIIRRIFRAVADGERFSDIARTLNFEHIPAPKYKYTETRQKNNTKGWLKAGIEEGWTGRLISQIVHSERYVGDVIIQKTYTTDHLTHKVKKNNGEMEMYHIRDHHPAIISRELYEEVLKVLEFNRNYYGKRGGNKALRPFSCRLMCAHCGRFFTVYNSASNPIWICPSAKLNNGKSVCHAEKVYEEQIIRMFRRAVIDRFRLTQTHIVDNATVDDIMSGRFEGGPEDLSVRADSFVTEMQGRLESIQRHDSMERDRAFLKRQITAVRKGNEQSGKNVRLLKSQLNAMTTRMQFLADDSITEEMVNRKKTALEQAGKRLTEGETEEKNLSERLAYLESYWDELEDDYEYREEAIAWMETLPKGREGTVQFMNGLTSEYVKAFVLSVTVHSPLKYTVHWFDDTRTEVEMDSNIEDYRYTSTWIRRRRR